MRVAPAIVLASLAACWSESAKPPVAPEPAPRPFVPAPARVPSGLARTMWIVNDSDHDAYRFFFFDDGSLHYRSASGFWKDASWTLQGTHVHMEFNNRYSERDGTVQDTTMSGDAWNRAGHRWTWTAERADDFPYPPD